MIVGFKKLSCSIVFLLALLGSSTVIANPSPQTVKVGAYIKDLYAFSLKEQTFKTRFWLWFLADEASQMHPEKTANLVNAHTQSVDFDVHPQSRITSPVKWTLGEYSATIEKAWDLKYFPFDQQVLKIYVEDTRLDKRLLHYVADTENSRLDPAINVPGWAITQFKVYVEPKHYRTNFGDVTRKKGSAYSRFVIEVHMHRVGFRRFFQYFGGIYLALFLSLFVLFLPIEDINPRAGLIAGAIFATFGNKYLLDSQLVAANEFLLTDFVQLLTFLYLLFVMGISLVAVFYVRQVNSTYAKRINNCGIIVSLIFIPYIVGYLIYHAYRF